MSDLAEFLLARIGEDEAAARAAIEPDQLHPWGDRDLPPVPPEDVPREVQGYLGGTWGEHFARHDPARVLRRCESDRQIVEEHYALLQYRSEPPYPICPTCSEDPGGSGGGVQFPCETLRLLALPYADHLDYRGGWAA